MSLSDEFQIIDSCTADSLEKGDLILFDNDFIEVHSIEDNDLITISGYSYTEDDDVVTDPVPFDREFNLYSVA